MPPATATPFTSAPRLSSSSLFVTVSSGSAIIHPSNQTIKRCPKSDYQADHHRTWTRAPTNPHSLSVARRSTKLGHKAPFSFFHTSSDPWKPLLSLPFPLRPQSNAMVVKEEAQCWIEAYESGNEQGVSQARLVVEDEAVCALGLGLPPHLRKSVVVGYALTSKKIKSFLKPKLEGLARNKGILFVAIDPDRSLSDQGPFDIVLHKLTGKEWRQILEDYRLTHPEVTVLDPPDAIHHLRNRQYMLQEVTDMSFCDPYGTVDVPKQLVIKRDASSIAEAVSKVGLKLPLVAKPLVADGSAKSHELSLAYDQCSLDKLETPLVLQEFVNHGGVMFKVYVVGETIKVLRRFSLPDVSRRDLSESAGVFRFPRVSCAAASADDADLDPSVAELPPRPLLERFAKELRRRLGLRLFNMDIIREHGTRDRFYVIDINYFPGYGKMPEYEHIFTDFLLSLVKNNLRKRP